MNFCVKCGSAVTSRIPEGDNRQRFVCTVCGHIHYENPRVIVGCLPQYEDRVLLCKRAIEPRYGLWTLPAGFMENGETTRDGAARETWEEACARVSDLQLYRVFDVPYISQVYVFYRCQLIDGEHKAGPESLETRLYSEAEIPWDRLAFPVVREILQSFFRDRSEDAFPIQVADIVRASAPSDSRRHSQQRSQQ